MDRENSGLTLQKPNLFLESSTIKSYDMTLFLYDFKPIPRGGRKDERLEDQRRNNFFRHVDGWIRTGRRAFQQDQYRRK